jgi:hypothetical protein
MTQFAEDSGHNSSNQTNEQVPTTQKKQYELSRGNQLNEMNGREAFAAVDHDALG